jgi:hypothetical protein
MVLAPWIVPRPKGVSEDGILTNYSPLRASGQDLSSPGLTGRSSIPWQVMMNREVSGILDTPLSRSMTVKHAGKHRSSNGPFSACSARDKLICKE